MNLMGFEVDTASWFWVFMALAVIIAIGGLFFLFYFEKIHPKRKFKVYARSGVYTRNWRIYNMKVPTELDILSLLLGKRTFGFPISWFKQEFYDKQQHYVCQYIDGRIFPLPLEGMLGTLTFVVKECKNHHSDINWGIDAKLCPMCNEKLDLNPIVLTRVHLQAMKYNNEMETRAVYTTELDKESGMRIPLSEWLVMYDVGANIAEALAKSKDENKTILDQNNPFITALIAALPMAIIMIGFGFASYMMWQGMGGQFTEGAKAMADTAHTLLQVKNMTMGGT